MALVPDYDQEDDDRLRGGESFARPSGGGGGGAPAAPTPSGAGGVVTSDGGDFVPWERFISANKDVSQREADKLKGNVQGSVDRATSGREAAASAQSRDIDSNYAFSPVSNEPNRAPSAFGGQATAFSGSAQAPAGAAAVTPDTGMTIEAKRGLTDRAKDAPLGARDLETQLGSDKWMSLLGDTLKAQDEAKALGSEGGIQGLLAKQTGVSSPFDAALIGGAGGQDFRSLSKQYGGGQLTGQLADANASAVERWQSLMGDVQRAGLDRDADAQSVTDDAARRAQAERDIAEARGKIQTHLDYLNRRFPLLSIAADRDTFARHIRAHADGTSPEGSGLLYWARSIYGPDAANSPRDFISKLYLDIQNMSDEEFALFAQGFIPPWMGLGAAAMGVNGGMWWGVRNTNTQVGMSSVKDITNMSPEDRKDYEEKMRALNAFYDVLSAAMSAFGPVGAAASAAGSAVQSQSNSGGP